MYCCYSASWGIHPAPLDAERFVLLLQQLNYLLVEFVMFESQSYGFIRLQQRPLMMKKRSIVRQ